MLTIRQETPADIAAREYILDSCFGEERFRKTCQRLRDGRRPAEGLAFVAELNGRVVGTVRLWHISAGSGRPALMLGPIALDPVLQGAGIGAKLMRHALGNAALAGHAAVLLVGDAPYYGRFGFSQTARGDLRLPGPYAPERLLGLELTPGALAGAAGLVTATGEPEIIYAPPPEAAWAVAA